MPSSYAETRNIVFPKIDRPGGSYRYEEQPTKGGKHMSRTIEAIMRHMVPPAKREPARKASGMEASMKFESRNPATGELLGVYLEHDKAETDARLQRAWDAWRHWSRTSLRERIAFLTRLAELLEERAETYSRLMTAEMGKPLADSIFEIKKCAWDAPPRRSGGGLSQATARRRFTGADHI
jgi:Aldehyde dehydrogenase family